MLAVRARCLVEAETAPLPPLASFSRRMIRDVEILANTAPPFGFVVELEEGVAIGEALAPVEPERIRRVVAKARDAPVTLDLPDEVLGLFVIDGAARRVTAAASIRGNRPYSYHVERGRFVASTSLGALRDLGVHLEADETRFGEYLVYRCVVPPHTLCRDVRRMIAGETLVIDLDRGDVVASRVHAFPAEETGPIANEDASLDVLDDALSQEIERGLALYEHPALLLSGGLDSSLLAAIAVRMAPGLPSVSSSFSFAAPDDAEEGYALSVARHLGLRHDVHTGSEERYLAGLVRGIQAAEEPLHHLQSVLLFLLFEEVAQQGQDLLFSGEGADGLFGNDTHVKVHKYRHALALLRVPGIGPVLQQVFRLVGARLPSTQDERVGWFGLGFGNDLDDHHLLWTLGAYGDRDLVKSRFGCDDASILESYRLLVEPYRDLDLLQRVSIVSLLCEGATTMSLWGKLAESQGLPLHHPFTAPRIVDTAFRLPWSVRLAEPKHFVRALLRRHGVPESLIDRPKKSFGFPPRHWAPAGSLFQPLVDMASDTFDARVLGSLQTVREDRAMILWNLLGLFLWKQIVIEGTSTDALTEEILARRRPADRV